MTDSVEKHIDLVDNSTEEPPSKMSDNKEAEQSQTSQEKPTENSGSELHGVENQ